jgi:hypothetical protein
MQLPTLKNKGENMKEGTTKIIKKTWTRKECEECGDPASKRHTYLLQNCRNNPRSSAYGRDDCSWSSDYEVFSCEVHSENLRSKGCPDGMSWCATFTWRSDEASHMFYSWEEQEIKDMLASDFMRQLNNELN